MIFKYLEYHFMRNIFLILFSLSLFSGFSQLSKGELKALEKEVKKAHELEDYEDVLHLLDSIPNNYDLYANILSYKAYALYKVGKITHAKDHYDVFNSDVLKLKSKLDLKEIKEEWDRIAEVRGSEILNYDEVKDSFKVIIDSLKELEIQQDAYHDVYVEYARRTNNHQLELEELKAFYDHFQYDRIKLDLAKAYFKNANLVDGLKYAEEALKFDSSNFDAYNLKTEILLAQRQYRKALKTISKSPYQDEYYTKYWKARCILDGLIKDQYSSLDTLMLNLKIKSKDEQDLIDLNWLKFKYNYHKNDAIECFYLSNQLIDMDSVKIETYLYNRTNLFDLDLLNRPKAELLLGDLEILLNIDPMNAGYREKQTRVLAFYGNLQREPINEIEQRVISREANDDDYKVVCEYYAYLDPEKAENYAMQYQFQLRKKVREMPTKDSYMNLANAYEVLKVRDLKESELKNYIKYITEAINLDEEDVNLKWKRANRFAQIKQWSSAQSDLDLISDSKFFKSDLDFIKLRVHCYIEQGNLDKAKDYIEKGLSINAYDRELLQYKKKLQ